ncbi:MAG TPA: hypothetical protein VMW27_15425 [Thermoanaerobaculia bacterium]|nr:hypothetical protein [Thermoanaerobaculia bacterium]
MRVDAEAMSSNATLSEVAGRFLDLASRAAAEGQPLRFDKSGLPPWALRYPYKLQDWPTFLDPEACRRFGAAAVRVSRLVKSVPQRIFDGDAERISAFYGFAQPDQVAMALSEPNGIPGALTRVDCIDGPSGLRCLECNATGFLGGWQGTLFARRLLENPWMREFLARNGLSASYIDPMQRLYTHIAGEAVAGSLVTGDELNVAFLVGDHPLPPFAPVFAEDFDRLVGHLLPGLSGRLIFCRAGELRNERGSLLAAGKRMHAVVEYHGGMTPPPVFRALKLGMVNVYNGPSVLLLSDKRNLALLSEHEESDAFTAGEREDIRSYIPWSRLVREGATTFHGERVVFPGFLLAERERLVIKDGLSTRGEGVHIGAACGGEEWAGIIQRSLATGSWMAQELVPSFSYLYQEAGGEVSPHDLVWGLFAFGDTHGGIFLRMMPQGRGGIINSARGASEGLVYKVSTREEP